MRLGAWLLALLGLLLACKLVYGGENPTLVTLPRPLFTCLAEKFHDATRDIFPLAYQLKIWKDDFEAGRDVRVDCGTRMWVVRVE